jgi:hypothetical protein
MYDQHFSVDGDVLIATLRGQFPKELLQELPNAFSPLADECKLHGLSKALIDARSLEVELDTLQLFQAGKNLSEEPANQLIVAIVAPYKQKIDPFFEIVAANRGAVVKIFTEFDEARNWLDQA